MKLGFSQRQVAILVDRDDDVRPLFDALARYVGAVARTDPAAADRGQDLLHALRRLTLDRVARLEGETPTAPEGKAAEPPRPRRRKRRAATR